MTKPKFKVGDRLINKSLPEISIIIKEINGENCLVDCFEYGFPTRDSKWYINVVEEYYTLDLNHYIKNL